MKFEKLNYSNSKGSKMFIYGFMVCAIIMIIINLFLTKAKYQVTESIPLANGTINYNGYDFKIMAMYIVDGSKDTPINKMPDSGYTINEKKSYCTLNNTDHDTSAKLYTNDNGEHIIKGLSKNEKCYLYFDKILTPSEKTLEMLNQSSLGEVGKITGTACGGDCDITDQNGIYEAEDDFGTSYVYRGTVDNNWVKFGTGKGEETGDIWWRIIRINGNGTIRLIYAGTSSTTSAPSTTGETTMIKPRSTISSTYQRAVYFNQTYNDNKYVGYMYPGSAGQSSSSFDGAHKVDSSSTKSTVLEEIEYWYTNNTNLSTLADKYIDVETGFCSDTTVSKTNHGSSYPGTGSNLGYGSTATVYGAEKVWQANNTSWNTTEQKPTLKCTTPIRDLYTGPNATTGGTKGSNGVAITGNNALPVPVGLITMDEVIYAGGFAGKTNNGYWLYTNQYYWTMSPYNYYYNSSSNQNASVFYVYDSGRLSVNDVNHPSSGVRPVINLKADTKLTTSGGGTEGSRTNPYIVTTD